MVVGLCISGLLPRGGSKGPYLVEVPCIKKKKKKKRKEKKMVLSYPSKILAFLSHRLRVIDLIL